MDAVGFLWHPSTVPVAMLLSAGIEFELIDATVCIIQQRNSPVLEAEEEEEEEEEEEN